MNNIFFHTMPEFIDILERNGSIDRLYSALKTDNLAEAVMSALDIINNSNIMAKVDEHFKKKVKCEQTAFKCVGEGNRFTRIRMYREALVCYNLALMFAPTNTESMILALNGRSEVHFEVGAKDACLKDIELCRAMVCSEEITAKLESRKANCGLVISTDKYNTNKYTFAREYFKFDVTRNKDISCASEDVDIVRENGFTKIVAARDIKAGKVVAIEPAFVAVLEKENSYTSCHYCHKLSLNLIPCDGCCSVLFCNEECKKQCFKEYHKIECQVIDVIKKVSSTAKCSLSIAAALKIREMSDSWEDFISHSLKIDKNRMKESSISEIYNHKNKKSILNFNDEKHFVHGKIFNQSFPYAVILKYLNDVPEYLPHDDQEKSAAQAALARIMLHLYVNFHFELDIQNSMENMDSISTEPEPNIGLFSFASKLTHSCMPNLLSVGLGNKLALISVKSIKKGTELTISFTGHWSEASYEEVRVTKLFFGAEVRCQCRVCIEEWSFQKEVFPVALSNEQSKCFQDFRSSNTSFFGFINVYTREIFEKACRALELFENTGNSREFNEIFRQFRNKVTLYQYLCTQNKGL